MFDYAFAAHAEGNLVSDLLEPVCRRSADRMSAFVCCQHHNTIQLVPFSAGHFWEHLVICDTILAGSLQ